MAKDWTFCGERDCPDCDATGKPKEPPLNQQNRLDAKPVCKTCNGSRIEKRVFTKEALRSLI